MNKPSHDILKEAVQRLGGFAQAAREITAMGYPISRDTVRRTLEKVEEKSFEVIDPGYSDIDVKSLIRRRAEQYDKRKRQDDFDKLIPVKVNVEGPVGIGFFGDAHLDNDGCDVDSLFRHVDIFDGRQDGLFASFIGDATDNWIGRLSKLYEGRSINDAEAFALLKDFVTRVNWLFFIKGNHDLWRDNHNILDVLLDDAHTIVRPWRTRLALNLPSGRDVRIYAAHSFPGRSMYTPVYGAMKKATLDGGHDLYVAGHIHTSAYTHGRHPGSGKVWHALQVGAYKKVDEYAEELNLEDQSLYPCPVALIDPNASDPINFIRIEFTPEEAAERLSWMRHRWSVAKSAS